MMQGIEYAPVCLLCVAKGMVLCILRIDALNIVDKSDLPHYSCAAKQNTQKNEHKAACFFDGRTSLSREY